MKCLVSNKSGVEINAYISDILRLYIFFTKIVNPYCTRSRFMYNEYKCKSIYLNMCVSYYKVKNTKYIKVNLVKILHMAAAVVLLSLL